MFGGRGRYMVRVVLVDIEIRVHSRLQNKWKICTLIARLYLHRAYVDSIAVEISMECHEIYL